MANTFLDSIEEYQLEEISFKLFSPDEIRNKSVVEINVATTYDQSGLPVPHGLMDLRLGVIHQDQFCQTCKGDYISCTGHTGHIELVDPVIHIEFADIILKVLNKICLKCSKLLFEEVCNDCNYVFTPITLEKPSLYLQNKVVISSTEIRSILEKITSEDLKKLNINTRLEDAVLTVLIVPSVKTRPSIFLQNGRKAEDDLTHKLLDIIKINEKIKKIKQLFIITAIYTNLFNLLTYHVSTYFNNTISGLPVSLSKNSKQIKSLIERIKGKTGRFRSNLAGKRINHVARSVITPAPNISISEIILPQFFAEQLSMPFFVNENNIDYFKQLILNYPNYPCILYVTNLANTRLKIIEVNKQLISDQLAIGYKIERQLVNNDYVLVNRQPTLHKLSIQAHKIKVIDQKTIGLHPCVCAPYNADFDGDEMNIHVPQNSIAYTESVLLMNVEDNIITSKNGKPAIGAIADVLSGLYILSTNIIFTKSEFTYITKDLKLEDKNIIILDSFTILSLLFKNDFNFYYKTKNNEVIITKGIFIAGKLDKTLVGTGGLLYDAYIKNYSNKEAAFLLNNFTKLSLNLLSIYGLTYNYIDNKFEKNLKDNINTLIQKKEEVIKNMEDGSIIKSLNELRDEIVKLPLFEKENSTVLMTRAGSAGSQLNYIQVTGTVGLQSFSQKRNINAYGMNKTYSLELKTALEKISYIKSSYSEGLNSFEFFEQACAARDSEIDVYIKTSTSGYLQRRLINCLNDIYINKNNLVTDSYNKIIQFKCGQDNLDFRKINKNNPYINLDFLNLQKKVNNSIFSVEESTEFISMLNETLKVLPLVFLQGIVNYCLKYSIDVVKINENTEKILKIYETYTYDSFEPIGLVSAQSIGEPATQMTLKSKHVSGIAELKLTTGLERIIEIFNAIKEIKTPSMTFILKDLTKKNEYVKKIVTTFIYDLFDISLNLDTYCIILNVKNEITIDFKEIYSALKAKFSASIKLIADENETTMSIFLKIQKYEELYKIYRAVTYFKVTGINNLENLIITRINDGYKIVTNGSNLKETKATFKDLTDISYQTNDIFEIFDFYGLEVARYYLVKEINSLLKKQGLDVALFHINLIADLMCTDGKILPLNRTGVMKNKKSTIAKAAFEIASTVIMNAAIKEDTDKLQGVFENAVLGKSVNIGTEKITLTYE